MVNLDEITLYGFVASILAILTIGVGVGIWISKLKKRISEIQHISQSNSSVLKIIVDALITVREKMLSSETVSAVDFVNAFSDATKSVSKTLIEEYFEIAGERLSNPDPLTEHRKRMLLEKSRRGTITYDDAQELKALLEKQKRGHESGGDIVGAILAGLLILFVIGVIASLLSEE